MTSNPVGIVNRIRSGIEWRTNLVIDRASRVRWRLSDLSDLNAEVDSDPKFALVVTGRNDNYGGDFRGRLAATLEWNLQYERFIEAIYVEWNPLPTQPSDAEWLVKKFKNLRVYIVSPERHKQCCTNPKMPMMEYFAKNVGIRRAKAPWICAANADVLIGPDMFERMSRLRTNAAYCSHNVNIRWSGSSIKPSDLTGDAVLGEFSADNKMFSVSGDFVLAHRDRWMTARGYDESLTDRRISCDGHGLAQLYHHGAVPRVLGRHYPLDHPESCRNATLDHQGNVFDPEKGIPYLNAETWGQTDAEPKQVGERTFFLA